MIATAATCLLALALTAGQAPDSDLADVRRLINGGDARLALERLRAVSAGELDERRRDRVALLRGVAHFHAEEPADAAAAASPTQMPLHVEILYNEYQFQAAFAVASLLALLALVTLVVKTAVERRIAAEAGEQAPLIHPGDEPPSVRRVSWRADRAQPVVLLR